MSKTKIYESIKHLFIHDDGSLPDIFIQNLTPNQYIDIYNWIRNQVNISIEYTVWDTKLEKDIPIVDIENLPKAYLTKRVEVVRHGLDDLRSSGVLLPHLSIALEGEDISLDYRMGKYWNQEATCALFEFLSSILTKAPNAKIIQADEGNYQKPNTEFEQALSNYYSERNLAKRCF